MPATVAHLLGAVSTSRSGRLDGTKICRIEVHELTSRSPHRRLIQKYARALRARTIVITPGSDAVHHLHSAGSKSWRRRDRVKYVSRVACIGDRRVERLPHGEG